MTPPDEPTPPPDRPSREPRSATASTPVTGSNTTVSRPDLPSFGPTSSDSGPLPSMTNIPSLHIPMLGSGYAATATASPAMIALPQRRTLVPWLVVAAIVALAYVFRATLTLGFAAFAIAYVVSPLVRRVERWGVPRPLAILLVLFGGTATVSAVLAMLVPQLLRQTQHLIASVPTYSGAIQRQWIPWIRDHLHLQIPSRTQDALAHFGLRASTLAPRLGGLLDNTLTYTVSIVEAIFTAFIVFALTFYLLMDFDSVLEGVRSLVPHRARPRTQLIVREIDDTLRHFVAGQLLVMAILGALYAVGLGIIGVPAGWAIGLFAGMISFVPYLGFFVALGLAMIMAALEGHGAGPVLAAIGMMVAVHILDLTLITPRILGGRAKISPVTTILALIAGGSVFGFAGVLIAIPVASVLKVLLRELISVYRNTQFFLAGSSPATASAPFIATPGALASDLNAALFSASVTAGGTPIVSTPTVPTAIQPDPTPPSVPSVNIPPLENPKKP